MPEARPKVHGCGFDGPVPVELKLAGKWTGPELFERLENSFAVTICATIVQTEVFLCSCIEARRLAGSCREQESRGFCRLIVALQDHWGQISPSLQMWTTLR
jgi:hypothetical protein